MDRSLLDDETLLADREDPGASFAAFYRRHASAVLRFVASRGVDADTAADVVAETFCVALDQRGRYRSDRGPARLWLLGIAVRKLADAHRRAGREARRAARAAALAGPLSGSDRDEYAALAEESAALDALADLPEAEREAVRQRVVDDRSYREIAEAFGLTEAAARQRVSRGLARLRTRLERP